MRATWSGWVALLAGLTLLVARPVVGQSAYVAGGVGPTPVLDRGSGNRNWFGVAGYPGKRGIGFRVSGAETVGRLWLSAELTLQPATPRVVRPYGLLGGGVVVDFDESDPIVTLGGGLRVQFHRLVFLFGEARLQTVIPTVSDRLHESILPISIGIGIGT